MDPITTAQKNLGNSPILAEDKIIINLQNKINELNEDVATDESILQAIGDGLVVVDMDGRIVMVNQAFEKLLLWTQEEVLGMQFAEIIEKQDGKGNKIQSLNRLKKLKSFVEHQTIKDDYYYVRKDGSKFPVALTTAPIIKDEEQLGIVQIFRDISEEKDVENSKNQFVSIASHQLRTPLSSINWYSEMFDEALKGKLDEENEGYLQEIIKASKRMTTIVNCLLNVSRIELGTLVLEPDLFNSKEFISKIVEGYETEIKDKALNLTLKLDESSKVVSLPKVALETIVSNLLINSIKYTAKGGSVMVETKLTENSIQLIVADSGYGIPKDEVDKVFTKLFRGSNIKKIDTDGTGVGLFIVKSMVDQLGGEIWFKTVENRGTYFWVELKFIT